MGGVVGSTISGLLDEMDADPIRRFNQSLISEFSFSLTILLLFPVANFDLFLKLQCGRVFNSSISSMGTSLGVQD